ncbi:ParA family protein [Novacetimonas hansenii]|uniref:Chromosome partitioning protein ParA n=1 Tax=Novacetimonas hansenii TaxID=436 RepID=A0ABQ0SHD5_NOVHA|nr:ParA family protein [Novacetimonas hansenii]GAN84025.1 chromosome partitioning ATPase ParA [Novacetimonas hansenii JCM 7643]GEC64605.1 chromosome partitioning protein ParA [Novacetimonas hansenii]
MKKVLAFSSSKGGAGKSTTCQIVAQVLAHKGQAVTILDADPNKPQERWRTGDSKLPVKVIGDITENNVVTHINAIEAGYVLIDLEGVASRLVARAIAKADTVIVPFQASTLDANQAGRTINLIKEEEELLEREIPFKVMLSRTNPAIQSRLERDLAAQLARNGLPLMENQLNERSSYKAIFAYKTSLYELSSEKVNGIEKAIMNAEQVTKEIVS